MKKLFLYCLFACSLMSNPIQSNDVVIVYTSDDPAVALYVVRLIGGIFSVIGQVLSTAEVKVVNPIQTVTKVHTDVTVSVAPPLLVYCAAVLICYKYLSNKPAKAKSVKH
ncbi:MAG: hypothetical protein EBU90_23795 [Proteobacteria bacterium]|nr:hypothetical protein [Pseudomonadota bacterium]NBP15927.1 hypothetical protein [bacterium]